MKKILLLIIICLLTSLSSCYVIETMPTPVGYEEYIKSVKKRKEEKKRYNKYHKVENRRIKKLQNAPTKNYNY